MAIHIEAIAVIARVDALAQIPGAIAAFEFELRNGTYATDGSLARGAFMSPRDVEAFVARMEDVGLLYEVNGVAVDIAVADQLHGLAVPAPWLILFEEKLGPDQRVKCAKLKDGLEGPVVFPPGWEYKSSLYFDFHFVPLKDEHRIVPIASAGGVDSSVDLALGTLIHRATQDTEAQSKAARPPLSLARSLAELKQREQACIELICRSAAAQNLPLPELIVAPRPWWRPWPSRIVRPYPAPNSKAVGDLAEMYRQTYEADLVVQWVAILYGDEAGKHYNQVLASMRQRQGEGMRMWLENNPDGPLPSRRPVASDWLNRVDSELPCYDWAIEKTV